MLHSLDSHQFLLLVFKSGLAITGPARLSLDSNITAVLGMGRVGGYLHSHLGEPRDQEGKQLLRVRGSAALGH